ncbi:bacterial translation initiation factor 2 (bIF-2) [Desulfosporosinus acidiphilus SJ4]|uniref:Translation initiation factor IF-2 n=1 Tax=Desulfosporosinus acidiphilus (strain DSM 22704 / JCM 16185 / SJ4) TaxID=646529 RepID=I4D9F1_DESAJ|nr:translation initiation factor IF-2 [Desulfosporosinus acidiphilus]AFM42425.1 bacterial translation initiation factor 2 (bIF-2) [Desulfosporosinus acidiphilus SJ4]
MSIRVHELAKELNFSSKEIISRLLALGTDVKNHLSTVDEKDADRLRGQMKGKEINLDHSERKNSEDIKQNSSETVQEGRTPETRHGTEGRPQGSRVGTDGRTSTPRSVSQGQPQGSRPSAQTNQGPRPNTPGPSQGARTGAQGPRPGYQGQPSGPRPGYQGQSQGPRPGYQGQPQGPRPGYQGQSQGPRPGYQGQPQGPRPGYQGQSQGPRPGYQGQSQGPRPGYQGQSQGPRPGYQGQSQGPRPGYQGQSQGPRPGYQGQSQGPRPGYQGQSQGPRPGYQGQSQGPRPGYQGQSQGPRPGYQGQSQGPRPGYQGQSQGSRPSPARAGAGVPQAPAIAEQVKRQTPATKKAQDKAYERKREMEKERENALRAPHKRFQKQPKKEVKDTSPKHIVIQESISVQDLALKMSRKAGELIKHLMNLGVMATINQELDSETATILANEMGVTVEIKAEKSLAVIEEIEDDPKDLAFRPPVVTVMGHVDHGKTSLLDAIRTTNVTSSEAGGITQHIGAYQVEIKGQKITFLDTPGHEAFTAMRARGAQVTDIAVLVVAADDGVMPQTVEAINHAKAAEVPIIVAINKIDKENATPERVKQELTEYGLVVEEWGGDTIAVPVSAKSKVNIEQLLEMILLVAEVRELKANPNRPAAGTVIEAELDKGKGPIATVLVSKGTLNVGDVAVAGCAFGKIRAMLDDKGRRVKKAGPAMPVEIQGLSEVPEAGEPFSVVADEKLARQITSARTAVRKVEESKRTVGKVSLEDLFDKIKEGEIKELNIIIKADVQGSVEALRQSLVRLSTDEVRVNPIHGGVGAINENDIMLASASNAIIIGFNVRADSNMKATADLEGVDLRFYRVIYDAIEDVKAAMTGLLDPTFKEVVLGRAEVRQVFKVPKAGTVAGCLVTEGKILRSAKVRVIRDSIVIHEGEMESLRRFKDDVKEVLESFECGIGIEKYNDLKEGDIIEAFTLEEEKRTL